VSDITGAIEMLKDSLPMCEIVLVTSLPTPGQRDERVVKAYEHFQMLQRKGKVAVTFLSEPRSPLAIKHGLVKQEEFIALALASMAFGSYHYMHNLPFVQLAKLLGDLSPAVGFSCKTAYIAIGKSLFWWGLLRKIRPSLPARGYGNVLDAINQSKL